MWQGGKVPACAADPIVDVADLAAKTDAAMKEYLVDTAIGYAIEALHAGNKFIQDTSPWLLKADDPKRLVAVRATPGRGSGGCGGDTHVSGAVVARFSSLPMVECA